jgi:hypothetical protein
VLAAVAAKTPAHAYGGIEALNGDGCRELLDEIVKQLPEGDP